MNNNYFINLIIAALQLNDRKIALETIKEAIDKIHKEENMLKEGMNNNHYNYTDFVLKDEKAKNIFGEFIQ